MTRGLRVVLERKLASDLTATLDYANGGVLELGKPNVPLQDAQQWIGTQRRHALAAKLSGSDRQRQQVQRDIENVRGMANAAKEFVALMDEVMAKLSNDIHRRKAA